MKKVYFQVGLEDFSSKPLHGGVLLITLTFFFINYVICLNDIYEKRLHTSLMTHESRLPFKT